MTSDRNNISKVVQGFSAKQLTTQFQIAAKSHFSGRLDLATADGRQWSLYFRLGRLIWTASSEHRFRRWYRLLKQFCPTIQPQSLHLREKEIPFYWEYLALSVLFKRQQIDREQAIALIQAVAREVLFDLLHASEQVSERSYVQDKQEELSDPIAPFNAEQLLLQAQQDLNDWYNAGLVHYSPNAVPVIKRPDDLRQCVSDRTYQTLETLINGQATLRDLARVTGQELLTLTRVLAPHFQRDLIGLNQIADLSISGNPVNPEPSGVTAPAEAPLIVCIDDSPQVCRAMDHIMQSAGYRFLGIEDSVHALPLLLEKKPSLIFLDLVMPIASGYEICAQIRRISVFKAIPIVILTGKDGIIDRVRARVVGASDFLSKPVDAAKVLDIVRQHLPQSASLAVPPNERSAASPPASIDESYRLADPTTLLTNQRLGGTSVSL